MVVTAANNFALNALDEWHCNQMQIPILLKVEWQPEWEQRDGCGAGKYDWIDENDMTMDPIKWVDTIRITSILSKKIVPAYLCMPL